MAMMASESKRPSCILLYCLLASSLLQRLSKTGNSSCGILSLRRYGLFLLHWSVASCFVQIIFSMMIQDHLWRSGFVGPYQFVPKSFAIPLSGFASSRTLFRASKPHWIQERPMLYTQREIVLNREVYTVFQ